MLAAPPHPFADAVGLVTLAAELPLRNWRDVVLPRYREVERTSAYRTALLALALAVDAMGYPLGRELLVCRSRAVAASIAWYAVHGRRSGLDARAAGGALASAALAVWARERLTPAQVAVLFAPFDALITIGSRA
jgi:hypothetical protein